MNSISQQFRTARTFWALHLAVLPLHLVVLPLHLVVLPLHLVVLPLHLVVLPLAHAGEVVGPEPMPFRRGDVDESGDVTQQDAELILDTLFAGGEFPCRAAADTNGDGELNAADGVYLLTFLEAAGPPPPQPYPDCGIPAPALLTCEAYICIRGTDFLRGDASGDSVMDITDAIFVLGFLFLGGEEPPCMRAADINGVGGIDLSDSIYALQWLFLGGPPPAPPFPDCGADEESPESCEVSSCA